jgi:type I restriction enzyme M protein
MRTHGLNSTDRQVALGRGDQVTTPVIRPPLQEISKLEASLWEAADNLRANSKLTSSEYVMPVLGVIFLRHASNRYDLARRQIEIDQAAGKMPQRAPVEADFLKRRALMLPVEARYDELLRLPKGSNFGTALVNAMNAVEARFEPLLNQLPKDYEKFGSDLLEDLLRIFDSEHLRTASGDVFGRIYEYFLMKFAMQGAQDNGEFFTPPSLVQLLVNMIEPNHGVILDPACGSGGMFVQSSHFIEREGLDTSHRVTFYGQEKTATTIRLAKMNLAVHGLEGDIREANTYYEDVHNLFGKCDFVLANPPFNVDMVDAEKVRDDRRLPFGLPGVNKEKKVSNGNFLWISYFHSYLAPAGRSGFVMSSQASSAGRGEAEVRRKLVETGDVDVMVAIRPNFFYTRSVPCELWSLDKGKPAERRNLVLMIDARSTYRKVTRKIYDFAPEQLQNITAIIWLYRGESERFVALVKSYVDRALEASGSIEADVNAFIGAYEAMRAIADTQVRALKTHEPIQSLLEQRNQSATLAFAALRGLDEHFVEPLPTSSASSLDVQRSRLGRLSSTAAACRDAISAVEALYTVLGRLSDEIPKSSEDAEHRSAADRRAASRSAKDLDARRAALAHQLKQVSYFESQAQWLLGRFPDARFVNVPGLCRAVSQSDIAESDWSLGPGRYVGLAPETTGSAESFKERFAQIHDELQSLNVQARELEDAITRVASRVLGS